MAPLELKCFTVAQVKAWLKSGVVVDGLSDAVISSTRAFAIINNPFVDDSSVVVSALYSEGELAAYTACFPEVLQNQSRTCWWFSTLSCKNKFEGKGYGLIVVGSLCERNGIDNCFDLGGAHETVEIFNYLGLNLARVPLYELSTKSFSNNLKGKLAKLKNEMTNGVSVRRSLRKVSSNVSDQTYALKYPKYIDDTTYHFIEHHSRNDVFLRKQETLNWIISYPFMNESFLADRVPSDLAFSSTLNIYQSKAVQVLKNGEIIGFYIIRQSSWNLGIKYLYYDPEHREDVFFSIVEHILHFKNRKFHTMNKELVDFVLGLGIFPNFSVYDLSFSFPQSFGYESKKTIQGGDGDLFV